MANTGDRGPVTGQIPNIFKNDIFHKLTTCCSLTDKYACVILDYSAICILKRKRNATLSKMAVPSFCQKIQASIMK